MPRLHAGQQRLGQPSPGGEVQRDRFLPDTVSVIDRGWPGGRLRRRPGTAPASGTGRHAAYQCTGDLRYACAGTGTGRVQGASSGCPGRSHAGGSCVRPCRRGLRSGAVHRQQRAGGACTTRLSPDDVCLAGVPGKAWHATQRAGTCRPSMPVVRTERTCKWRQADAGRLDRVPDDRCHSTRLRSFLDVLVERFPPPALALPADTRA